MGVHVIPLVKFVLVHPAVYIFGVNPLHSHMASQAYCRLMYFVPEFTQITCRRTDIKISLWLFAVMRSWMTSKSGYGQTDPTAYVTNLFELKSVWDRGQVPFPKCLFQYGEFNSPHFKCFTTVIDHFFNIRVYIFTYTHYMCVYIPYWTAYKIDLNLGRQKKKKKEKKKTGLNYECLVRGFSLVCSPPHYHVNSKVIYIYSDSY